MRPPRVLARLLLLYVAISGEASGPDFEATIRQFAAAGSLPDLRWPRFPDYRVDVTTLYESVGYRPVWVRADHVSSQGLELIQAFQHAATKGLNPEDYDAALWAARLDALRAAGAPVSRDAARVDLALTVSAMRYVSDLHLGRVNPQLCHFGFDVKGKRLDLAALFRDQMNNAPSVAAILDSLEPPYPGYRRLRDALQTYLALAGDDDGELLPATRKPVEPGDSYSGGARLARLLRRVGDLPSDTAGIDSNVYQGALVDALKRFQRRHGLEPDGRIGKTTLDALNTPLSRRVRQMQLTLERWRWVPHEFAAPPIVVNIPEFRLRAFDGAYRSELEMNVVVGKAYRTRTPVFTGDLRHVIFRPYWNVPRSIERAELMPKIVRDRAYASRNDYEILDASGKVITGDVVSDETIRLLRLGRAEIRQVPGPKNALGLVKFLFPNEYSVYMHDTPSVALFSKARRDFSHGCIRVEKPEELAVWVLKGYPEWTRERIRQAMTGDKTLQVNLRNPIPVMIVYGTAVAPEGGEMRFLADIYGHDASLEAILAKGHPYSD